MKINKKQDGSKLVIALEGRLDTTTAPDLEKELKTSLDGVTDLTLDLTNLDYISSAGLRVLLSTHKTMMKQGQMKLTNASDIVKEVFDVTGFSDILTVE